MEVSAIIVAGGSGKRMGHPTRKQYLLLGGRLILNITLHQFLSCGFVKKIVLVIPEDDAAFCQNTVLSDIAPEDKVILVKGGKERQDSVYNGLLALDDKDGIVLIHDGVRPFISCDMIQKLSEEAEKSGACIPCIPAFDTLKMVSDSGVIQETVKREGTFFAQTPQAFRYKLIRKAYDAAIKVGYLGTDDASLLERIGHQVKVINGNRKNIKITTKEDLQLGEAILKIGRSDSF